MNNGNGIKALLNLRPWSKYEVTSGIKAFFNAYVLMQWDGVLTVARSKYWLTIFDNKHLYCLQPSTPSRANFGTIACTLVNKQIRYNRLAYPTRWHEPILQIFACTRDRFHYTCLLYHMRCHRDTRVLLRSPLSSFTWNRSTPNLRHRCKPLFMVLNI